MFLLSLEADRNSKCMIRRRLLFEKEKTLETARSARLSEARRPRSSQGVLISRSKHLSRPSHLAPTAQQAQASLQAIAAADQCYLYGISLAKLFRSQKLAQCLIKNTGCSSKRAEFNSQHWHGSSQPSETLVPGDLPSSGLTGHQVHKWYTDMHADEIHTHASALQGQCPSLSAHTQLSQWLWKASQRHQKQNPLEDTRILT